MVKYNSVSQQFLSEREGQQKLFDDLKIKANVELTNNTDGIYKGTLFEFKLNIADVNRVLFQAIKYLSHMRIKGNPVPAQILLVALNEELGYVYSSNDFLKEIEKIYAGAASKNNADFATSIEPEKIDYSTPHGLSRILEILDNEQYTKINIDVFDVVGWAEHFYSKNPEATKSQLFDELRQPNVLKNYIYPWQGDDIDFKYINDLLNAKTLKKELGAFYTPSAYCRKATELVRKAIQALPDGHDYIILDRSAGTGNLEEFLTNKPVDDITIGEINNYIDKEFKRKYLASVSDGIDLMLAKNSDSTINTITLGDLAKYETTIKIRDILSDNEIGHTIVNTYELKEWIVLNERLGDKVRLIIPPEVDPSNEVVNGGDALSNHFVLGSKSGKLPFDGLKDYYSIIDELNDYIADEKTNIILLENPPFRDESSNSHMQGGARTSFVKDEMKKAINGSSVNDLSNQFIWSGWEYYLHKPDDYFVLFSPIKYWKSVHLTDKGFIDGYLFNRIHFHTKQASSVACILWRNVPEARELLKLSAFDIDTKSTPEQDDDELLYVRDIEVKKVYKNLSVLYDKSADDSDSNDGVACELNGTESSKQNVRVTKKYNENVIGYLVTQQFGFENPRLSTNLTRCAIYNGNGFFLRKDNYLEKLPLFAAGKMPVEKSWLLNGVIFKTADGGEKYLADHDFLKSCFIFASLSYYNKCRSFEGSDGRFYKNELCFDEGTLAYKKVEDYTLTNNEKELLETFKRVLQKAKDTDNYNPKFTYGTYQIDQELNTRHKDENEEWVYDYPLLNGDIVALKRKLANYYEAVIQPKLFEYELLK